MLDAKLIAAGMESRSAWEKIAPHFSADEFTPISRFWFDQLKLWYSKDPQVRSVDKTLFIELAKTRIKNKKHEETLIEFINGLPESPGGEAVVTTALELKRYNVSMQLGQAIAQQNHKDIAHLIAEYQRLREATQLGVVKTHWQDAVAVEDLYKSVSAENRIPLLPSRLNAKLGGGALPGHHIIFFGRPDAGKSLLAINAAYGFMKQRLPGIYMGNEDQIDILKARMVSRVVGRPSGWCEANAAEAARIYRERGGEDYILMTQLKHGTMESIDKRVAELRPKWIVIDQIRNIETDSADGKMTSKLESLGRDMRNLLLDYGLIGISVTQARSRETRPGAEQPIHLGLEDIDSSHTGLPGTGDAIVGIAGTHDMIARGLRQLSIAKNKLSSRAEDKIGLQVEVDMTLNKVQ